MTVARATSAPAGPARAAVISRILAAVLGGYLFTSGAVALGAALLAGFGLARSEAVLIFAMLGFPIYLAVALRVFAARRLGFAWLVLVGGGVAMAGLGYLLARVAV